MALARTRRGESGMNYWPGFVDALSTLILSIIFILTVFVVVQFYLQQEVAGKDTALTRLNAQIAQLTELLSLEKTGKANLEDQLAQLQASLASAASEACNCASWSSRLALPVFSSDSSSVSWAICALRRVSAVSLPATSCCK